VLQRCCSLLQRLLQLVSEAVAKRVFEGKERAERQERVERMRWGDTKFARVTRLETWMLIYRLPHYRGYSMRAWQVG
jgi:hypothetical protein